MQPTASTSPHTLDAVLARAMGLTWPLQVVVVAAWIAVPHPPDARQLAVALIALAALPLYLPLLVMRRPSLTRRGTNIAMVLGVVQMGAMVWAGGGLSSGFELLPLWFVPVTVCLVPRLDVAAELMTVVVGAAVAAIIEAHGATSTREDPMWGFAVMAVATLLVNTAIAGRVHSELRSVSERFRRRSVQDPLTELANRSAVTSYIAERYKAGMEGAAYVIDVDGFKFVNDSLGHHAGDRLLVALADRLRSHARAGDLLARTGGDEFVLIAPGVRASHDLQALGDRLLDVCERPFTLDGFEASMSITVGCAGMDAATNVDEALRNADLALYAAKSQQRGTARLFEAPMRAQAATWLSTEHHLRRALDQGELRVLYQPIVSLDGAKVTSFEALLRWRSAALGEVSPMQFIPVAERTGMILPIGRFVLEQAVRQLAAWRQRGHQVKVTVNLSASQLADDHFPDLLAGLLGDCAVTPAWVHLELTESTLMERATGGPLAMLDRLREVGVGLSLDDFGTGYSSLSRLSQLRLSAVKIDRSFVARMLTDATTGAIVNAVLRMAEPMQIDVIAEGVETIAQRDALARLGCRYAQGYLFARPLEAGAAELLLDGVRDSESRAA
ncbi:MAG: EAL domain-containing protein [Solirubrobacteraceae bacterium]